MAQYFYLMSLALRNCLRRAGILVHRIGDCAVHGPLLGVKPHIDAGLQEVSAVGAVPVGAQRSNIPVGRYCEPEEVAHAVSFLAFPLADFITGEVIDMNGGLQFD